MRRTFLALMLLCAAFALLNLGLGIAFGHWFSFVSAAWSATGAVLIGHMYRTLP